jgi:hypothetical protein
MFYVTASHIYAGAGPRTDLAKFTTHADASAFAQSLHKSWIDVKIELREE